MRDDELRNLARRAIGRALADRGRAAAPEASSNGALRRAGVSVDPLRAEDAPRPGAVEPAARRTRRSEVVTARCLDATPDGGEFVVPFQARVTPLAREEAWRRRIRLVGRAGSAEPTGSRLRVALASDHGGFQMKQDALVWVRELGHEPLDLGPADEAPIDYPDQALAVALAVVEGRASLGIVVDGAGIGSAMAANKVPGIRAALCYDRASASNAREHNFANVLTLGGRMLTPATAREVVATFLATPTGAERHQRRVDKISAIEARFARTGELTPREA